MSTDHSTTRTVIPLSLAQRLCFAAGNLGWSLASYAVANLLNYFYVPNVSEGTAMFPLFVPIGPVFLGLTVIGIISSFGRVFDAVTDPLIASFSDRSVSRFGKRRVFMAIGALPLGVSSLAVFLPPVAAPVAGNVVVLAISITLFYLFFTMYMAPISAWVSELGHSSAERLDLATYSSIGWAAGFAIGNLAYGMQGIFEDSGLEPVAAFRLVIAIFALVSIIAMYLPVVFIDERRHAAPTTSSVPLSRAVRLTLRLPNFRVFLYSQLAYWIALTFIQIGISYFVVTVLGIDKSYATLAMTVLFGLSFLAYVPVNRAAKRVGKKRILVLAYFLLSVVYVLAIFIGRYPLGPVTQTLIIMGIASVPIAVFTIVPFAIIADIAELDGKRTGDYKAGTFFAVRGLVMKGGIAVANLLFPSIVVIGTGRANPFGVRLTAAVALVASLVGGVIFALGYREMLPEDNGNASTNT
jgi:Na+/melibiose symporter-like transporter